MIDNYYYQHLRQTDPSAVAVAQPDNAEQVLGLQRGEEEACVLLGRDRSDTHHILRKINYKRNLHFKKLWNFQSSSHS